MVAVFAQRQAVRILLLCAAVIGAGTAGAQDALRGKMLYHDVGRMSGAGVSCIDCHGGIPGGLHGIGKAAGKPSVIEEALGAIHQMAPLRGRVSTADMADLAAYLARPDVPSPDLRSGTVAADGTFMPSERVTFTALADQAGSATVATVRLVNAGAVVVRLRSGPQLAGPDAALFDIIASDCAEGRALGAGDACSVSVAFRPRGPGGLRSASLSVQHDWLRGASSLALVGRVMER